MSTSVCSTVLAPLEIDICLIMHQQTPEMAEVLQDLKNPEYKRTMEAKMEELRNDPEMGDLIKEIQEGGPEAMAR